MISIENLHMDHEKSILGGKMIKLQQNQDPFNFDWTEGNNPFENGTSSF